MAFVQDLSALGEDDCPGARLFVFLVNEDPVDVGEGGHLLDIDNESAHEVVEGLGLDRQGEFLLEDAHQKVLERESLGLHSLEGKIEVGSEADRRKKKEGKKKAGEADSRGLEGDDLPVGGQPVEGGGRGGENRDGNDHAQKLGEDHREKAEDRLDGEPLVDQEVHDEEGLLRQEKDHEDHKTQKKRSQKFEKKIPVNDLHQGPAGSVCRVLSGHFTITGRQNGEKIKELQDLQKRVEME